MGGPRKSLHLKVEAKLDSAIEFPQSERVCLPTTGEGVPGLEAIAACVSARRRMF